MLPSLDSRRLRASSQKTTSKTSNKKITPLQLEDKENAASNFSKPMNLSVNKLPSSNPNKPLPSSKPLLKDKNVTIPKEIPGILKNKRNQFPSPLPQTTPQKYPIKKTPDSRISFVPDSNLRVSSRFSINKRDIKPKLTKEIFKPISVILNEEFDLPNFHNNNSKLRIDPLKLHSNPHNISSPTTKCKRHLQKFDTVSKKSKSNKITSNKKPIVLNNHKKSPSPSENTEKSTHLDPRSETDNLLSSPVARINNKSNALRLSPLPSDFFNVPVEYCSALNPINHSHQPSNLNPSLELVSSPPNTSEFSPPTKIDHKLLFGSSWLLSSNQIKIDSNDSFSDISDNELPSLVDQTYTHHLSNDEPNQVNESLAVLFKQSDPLPFKELFTSA